MLAANGARVVIAEVDRAKAEETVATLSAEIGDGAASAFVADLVAPGACDDLVRHALDTYGALDIVVNNAGYAWDGGIHNMSDEQFQAMLDIHLVVPFRLARATAPIFRAAAEAGDERLAQRHRKTVLVSSLAGQWGLAGAANYAAAKAGMLGLMRTLAQEWGRFRVNVNAGRVRRHPDAVRVAAVRARGDRDRRSHDPRRDAGEAGRAAGREGGSPIASSPTRRCTRRGRCRTSTVALGRSGTIRDAADAIFWLCSPLSDYVTGQTITVSGGARGGMS